MSVRNLESLFQPATVVVVGISTRPGNIGRIVYGNLKGGQFPGPIWLVDHVVREVDGKRCFDNVDALPSAPELAVICTPPQAVPGIIEAHDHKDTHAANDISAG